MKVNLLQRIEQFAEQTVSTVLQSSNALCLCQSHCPGGHHWTQLHTEFNITIVQHPQPNICSVCLKSTKAGLFSFDHFIKQLELLTFRDLGPNRISSMCQCFHWLGVGKLLPCNHWHGQKALLLESWFLQGV